MAFLGNVIIFPGGAGGHWLRTLVSSLHRNSLISPPVNQLNFHDNYTTDLVTISHTPIPQWSSMPRLSNPKSWRWISMPKAWKVYSAECTFNIWLNNNKKWVEINPSYQELDDSSKIIYLAQTYYNRSTPIYNNAYLTDIDLNYQYIHTDTDQFTNQLFCILDEFGVEYTKNKNIVIDAIDKFVVTCANPGNIVGNIDSCYWISCNLAILQLHGIIDDINRYNSYSFSDLQSLVHPHQQLCIDHVEPQTLRFDQ